ncbi:MAG: hypothetical protein KDA37_04460, partial [Planctomycetales bacterium]|nr:hypothetical protein [Planctomycetales bacterium]
MTNLLRRYPIRLLLVTVFALTLAAVTYGQGPPGRGGAPSGRPMFGNHEKRRAVAGPSLSATDELVVDIRIEGNKTIPAERITQEMSTRVNRPFDPQALARDVRKLASMPWFTSVRPYSEHTKDGRVVILRVAERQTVRYVEYLGNSHLKDKRLAKETGLVVGSAVDPYLVEDGRRKIQQAYHDNGYANAQVSILEGNKPSDRGVVYVINEGEKQKISSVRF